MKEAEDLIVQVKEMRKMVLGTEHPDTLTSMRNLALMLQDQGRWKDAEELFVHVVEKRRILGTKHSGTLTSMANLAHTYYPQGHRSKAIYVMADAARYCIEELGVDHPDTKNAVSTLQE